MPDRCFANPRLADIYDDLDSARRDLDHYVAMAAEFGVRSVLDVGCGTGVLALRLAAKGLDVTGVDPAEASLAVARRKPGADRVRWVAGDATTIAPMGVDLVTMTGNVAQVFLNDSEWWATLAGIRTALHPSGRLIFEVRDPGRRGWEEWNRDNSFARVEIPGRGTGTGTVETWVELIDVSLPMVTFMHTYRFEDGSQLTSDSTLRFRDRDEIVASLTETGFVALEVRGAPDRPGKEHVFIAGLAAR